MSSGWVTWVDDAVQHHSCSSLTYAIQDPAHGAVPSTGQDTEIWGVPKEAQPGESQERERVTRDSRGSGRGQGTGHSISIPWRGPAAVQVVHLAWVEQVVELAKDPEESEVWDTLQRHTALQRAAPGTGSPCPPCGCSPGQHPTYRSPCLPPLLGFTSTSRGCVPGRGLIWKAQSTAANTWPPWHPACPTVARLTSSPAHPPTCSPCPSTVVELNLKAWLSSGLVVAGESLSDLRQWDCLSFGSRGRGVCSVPGGQCHSRETARPQQHPTGTLPISEEGATYQDNRADVGRQQDVVPQRSPITLRLHVGGTFVVELQGPEEGMLGSRHQPIWEPHLIQHRLCRGHRRG